MNNPWWQFVIEPEKLRPLLREMAGMEETA
jgi:hypothetical protein